MALKLAQGVIGNLLHVKNLSLYFENHTPIFKNINFSIEKNTITLINGKSGYGKSSLLMCISRVIPEIIEGKMSGEIIYNGNHIEDKDANYISGNIAYMFQDPDSQLCTFTVADEIAFGLENFNFNPNDMENTIDSVLDSVGISHLKTRQLNELSGGEKQKVAIASILAINPDLILMDEPTANLDPKSTQDIVNLIYNLKNNLGKTILLVEHKINEFFPIIDNIIEFHKDKALLVDKSNFINYYKAHYILPSKDYNPILGKELLDLKNINFSYDNKNLTLNNINFSLKQGEILGIIGSNGAGKSTLSKIIMGLLKPQSGSIYVNGTNLKEMTPKIIGNNMGLVFQNPEHQFIKITVEKELSLSLEIKKESLELINYKVTDYLNKFNLSDEKFSNPFTLSQGQKRRLSTASMLINGQPILILDEPTYGQDTDNLNELTKLLHKINRSGISILIITHDMNLVSNSCDRVLYIKEGAIKYDGDVSIGLDIFQKELEIKQ